MTVGTPTVFVVDDDPSVRKGMARLLASEGFTVEVFESGSAFLAHYDPLAPGCVLLDLEMPGISGMDLQHALIDQSSDLAIVFLTGRGDIHRSVQAMKSGAVDFLIKPVEKTELLAALAQALDRNAAMRKRRGERSGVEQRLALLTPREREVLACLASGRRNKQIAADLGTVEKTIKVHRARVLQKMQVKTLAELIQIVAHAGIELSWPSHAGASEHEAGDRAIEMGR